MPKNAEHTASFTTLYGIVITLSHVASKAKAFAARTGNTIRRGTRKNALITLNLLRFIAVWSKREWRKFSRTKEACSLTNPEAESQVVAIVPLPPSSKQHMYTGTPVNVQSNSI